MFFWFIITGIIVGFFGGLFLRGQGFGIIGNLAVGIIGAMLFGFVSLAFSDMETFLHICISAVGALTLLLVSDFIKSRSD
ncbi:MAG: GlsB/YeaQ/YmgE family stress response membrane protein [Bacteroidota bacterium]|nr:GlsB/YeaQ/YmgE family stress response membrane protein [Bacteroidota bacterium]